MTQSAESFVQVAPDGGGKAIRNLAFVELDSDGNVRTVYCQVTVAADPNTGIPLVPATKDWQEETTVLLRAIVRGLAKLADCEEKDLING
jgi:hypothetical protein